MPNLFRRPEQEISSEPSNIPQTSFSSVNSSFCVLTFGLRNGPAEFQWLMGRILHDFKDVLQVYIDNIAVFSSNSRAPQAGWIGCKY